MLKAAQRCPQIRQQPDVSGMSARCIIKLSGGSTAIPGTADEYVPRRPGLGAATGSAECAYARRHGEPCAGADRHGIAPQRQPSVAMSPADMAHRHADTNTTPSQGSRRMSSPTCAWPMTATSRCSSRHSPSREPDHRQAHALRHHRAIGSTAQRPLLGRSE